MNPPGDADTDGSPSNCTAFFISAVHDLSLYETHAPRSLPSHARDSLFPISLFPAPLSSLPVQLSLSFHFSVPFFLILHSCPPFFIPLCLCFYPCLCVCLSAALNHPSLRFSLPSLVLSLVQMCPWSVVAWLGDNRSDFETGGWQPCCH